MTSAAVPSGPWTAPALASVLDEHWGAVGRDLAMAHYTWADVGHALPFDQFLSFIFHAPQGTALYHERNKGWTVTDHLLTDLLETQDWLMWTKTKAGRENKKRPKRRPRPGTEQQEKADAKQAMTVEEYVKLTGMSIYDGKEV